MRTGFLEELDCARIAPAMNTLSEAPIYIDDTPNISTMELRTKARRLQAETGLASLTGPAEAPGRVGASVTDIAAGLNAYAAVLEALIARQRTGEGALIRVSLFDATAEWMAVPLIHLDYAGRAPAPDE